MRFEKMKYNPQGITMAMQLYFNGESLRNVAKFLRLIRVEVSRQPISYKGGIYYNQPRTLKRWFLRST